MKLVTTVALILAISSQCVVAEEPPADPKVKCEGTIVSFEKEGFQALMDGGQCEWFDVTWVRIVTPEEFAGVKFMLTSTGSRDVSPYGKKGDSASFETNRGSLEFWRDLKKSSAKIQQMILETAEQE